MRPIFSLGKIFKTNIRVFLIIITTILLLVLLVARCSWLSSPSNPLHQDHRPENQFTPAPTLTSTTNPLIHNVEVDMLNDFKAYGYNSDPNINNGLGGLFINWRYGTNPLQTNVNGSGETDDASGQALRHDPLTDLRYIHNLWLYKSQHPGDNRLESEIARYTPIIKEEFANAHDQRGWVYDIIADIFVLSQDNFYQDALISMAQNYAHTFNSQIGSIYNKYKQGTDGLGTYRVDNVLEAGCALVQAGTLFNNDNWIQDGLSTVKFVYDHAYIPQYHTFASQMSEVLQSDGTVNPNELFFVGASSSQNYTVHGNELRMGNISQMIISLLDTYQVTHNQDFLHKATDLIDPLSLPNNELGLWDTNNGGYFYSIAFQGPSPTNPGSIRVDRKRKEAGRQAIMLQALHMADEFTNNRYKDMEDRMLDVTLHHIYNPALHGVPYLVNADWSPPKFANNTLNNMDTTEAMGATLEALFSLNR
jgi:hypothetical protein